MEWCSFTQMVVIMALAIQIWTEEQREELVEWLREVCEMGTIDPPTPHGRCTYGSVIYIINTHRGWQFGGCDRVYIVDRYLTKGTPLYASAELISLPKPEGMK